ncbi:MAG: FtsX-like permease family protein [Lachnospiraceae bacterium]|nr:FtsX-like permease family protein [Lachnospiraceae bacterium]
MIKLVKAYMHKDRGILAAFLFIIVLSALIMHTGLFLGSYEKRYDRMADGNLMGDGGTFFVGDEDEVKNILKDIPEIKDYCIRLTVMPSYVNYKKNDSEKEKKLDSTMYFNMDSYLNFNDVDFIEKDESIKDSYIYLNVYTAYYNGLRVGDTMHISSENFGNYNLKVAGIYEDLLIGNPYSYLSVIVDDGTYNKLTDRAKELETSGTEYARYHFMFYSLKEGTNVDDGLKLINDKLAENGIASNGYTSRLLKAGYISVVNIMSAFMTSFSIIIMVICFIMIIFTINNNIERDIRNIGALRAVGYTVSQIRAALCLEFLILGGIGTFIGILMAYLAFPVLEENVIRQVSGMVWENKFYAGYTLEIIVIFLVVIAVVVYLSTGKVKKLHPATALRFGLASNSFKKNVLPLGETKGNLNVLLALKSSLQSMGQNIVIFGILTAVAFLTIFSGVLFYNTKIDMNNFQRLLQGDSPDSYVYLKDMSSDKVKDIIEEISMMDEVKEAYGLSSIDSPAYVNGYETTFIYTDKPEFVYCGVYEGKMLKEDNEAVLGSISAKKAGVGVGDEIEVKVAGKTERFLVTGLQQAVYGMGERIYVTEGGAKKLGIDTNYSYIRVRVKDANVKNVDEFNERVKIELGDVVTETENYFEKTRSVDNVPVYAVRFVVMIIALMNIIVVIVVIRLLLKSVFVKKEKEFGIKKAVGFTSSQLRIQLALSLTPTCIIASLFGAVLGHCLINPLFELVFRSFGIMKSDLIMKPVLIILSVVAVSILVFAASYIMSGKMKRVSVYNLIQE